MAIKKGDKVKIEYTGTLEDGTVFDSSEKHGQPLEFEVGSGKIIPGFENAVEGMEKDEEKEITLKPEEAYGEPNEQLIREIPRDQLPPDQEPKEGMVLAVGLPTGQQIPARIIEVSEDKVKLDMNHPLAGKTLKFKIKVIEVSSS